jgi:hypothetical protein
MSVKYSRGRVAPEERLGRRGTRQIDAQVQSERKIPRQVDRLVTADFEQTAAAGDAQRRQVEIQVQGRVDRLCIGENDVQNLADVLQIDGRAR